MFTGEAGSGTGACGRRAGAFIAAAAAAGLGWGWFEAGWVRLCELQLPVPGLPPELDGFRIAHLSDLHLGVPSRGVRAVERAFAWVSARRPDLVAITGDLLTRPRGEPQLRALVAGLGAPTFAILGNHDLADSRDPQARASNLRDLEPATLLRDRSVIVEVKGIRVGIAGIDPWTRRRGKPLATASELLDGAQFRILLCHYPRVFDLLRPGQFDLVLAGHMHDGQITIPYPGGKLRLAHLSARFARGVYRSPAGVMHVSPGLGTTFVPFRFAARPEATELVLRSA